MIDGMKNYFVVDSLSICREFINEQGHSQFLEWHALPVDDTAPDGTQLVVARFLHEGITSQWVSTPGVSPLPHPLNSSKAIQPGHHNILKRKFGTLPTDTVWDVAHKAGQQHPHFRLTAFW